MNLLFLNNIITSEFAAVIITVFLHSLWQGFIIATLAWASLRITRKWSAAARYNLLVLFLFSFVVCIIITFFGEWTKPIVLNNSAEFVSPVLPATVENIPFLQTILIWCSTNATWIFLVWCVVFLVKANQMIRGLIAVDRLKQFGTKEAGSTWTNRFAELKALLNIKKQVSLKESLLVSQPMVIGIFKPLVLVPIGLLNGLQPKEVEAILLHELAHIQRNDYLVNLLQSFLETIFFFNPAFYWLSTMIRNEREHCCDAVAIKHTESKKTFLQALLSFHQQSIPSPYAMALLGKNSLLSARVNRIVRGTSNKITSMEKMVVFTCYALLFISLVSFSLFEKKSVAKREVVKIPKTVFKPDFQSNKKSSAALNENVEPVIEPSVKAKKVDTIPKNASKEFIAGYKAAMKYKNEPADVSSNKKKEIEARLSKSESKHTTIQQADIAVTTTVTMPDAKEKKRIEEALVAEKKRN